MNCGLWPPIERALRCRGTWLLLEVEVARTARRLGVRQVVSDVALMTPPFHQHRHAAAVPHGHAEWDERYASAEQVWSGQPNGALVTEVTALAPGQALGVGCGEGADAVWFGWPGLGGHGTGRLFRGAGAGCLARPVLMPNVRSWLL